MSTEAITLGAVNQPHSGLPDAGNGHSFLRGNPNIRPTKSGYQKAIDRLTRQKYDLERESASLQSELARQAIEIENLREELEVMRGWKAVALRFREVFNKRGKQHG